MPQVHRRDIVDSAFRLSCSADIFSKKGQALGYSCGAFCTKIHVTVDALSNSLRLLSKVDQAHKEPYAAALTVTKLSS